jgi:hypothetical protein
VSIVGRDLDDAPTGTQPQPLPRIRRRRILWSSQCQPWLILLILHPSRLSFPLPGIWKPYPSAVHGRPVQHFITITSPDLGPPCLAASCVAPIGSISSHHSASAVRCGLCHPLPLFTSSTARRRSSHLRASFHSAPRHQTDRSTCPDPRTPSRALFSLSRNNRSSWTGCLEILLQPTATPRSNSPLQP